MWSRPPLRRSSLWLFRGSDRDKVRSRRDRRRPRLEVLEDRQLLSGATYEFSFGAAGHPIPSGYASFATAAYSPSVGYGWDSSSGIYTGGHYLGNNVSPLPQNFAYSANRTFKLDLPNGTYSVTPTLANYLSSATSQDNVWINGQQVASSLAVAPGQYTSPTYQVTVTTGQLDLQIATPGNKTYWELCGLVVKSLGPTASAGPNQTVDEESPVSFAGSVIGGVSPYTETWDFGDGTTATGTLTPTHVYTTPGTYTATLTVTDALGSSSTSSLVATVQDVPPSVNMGGPYQGSAQVAVSFSALATDVNPSIPPQLAYGWDFGDGTTGTGPAPSHTYAADGIYDVALTVTDPYGGATTAMTTVEVHPSVSAGLDPTVDVGSPVAFQGTAVGSSSFSYTWDFGDGTTATGTLKPSHVYSNVGTYVATLTATDSSGLSGSASVDIIVVNVPPTVSLSAPSDLSANVAASFTATATDPSPTDQAAGFTYTWDFGDETTATGAKLSHMFTKGGTFLVTVTATDSLGQTGTATAMVQVTGLPSFHFDFGPSGSAVAPGYTSVANTAYSSSTGYGWKSTAGVYTGGTWWPGANPLTDDFVYSGNATFLVDLPNGTYTVVPTLGRFNQAQSQVAIWLNGQQVASGLATAPEQFISPAYQVNVTDGRLAVQVQDLAKSSFDLDALSILPGQVQPPTANPGPEITGGNYLVTSFNQASATGTGPLNYNWYFGDGTAVTGSLNPTHVYQATGTYTAMLTVTDANGLVVANPVSVKIDSVPPAATITAPSIVATNVPVSFAGSATDPDPADQAAGFTYSWNFGDGATATGANPNHTFAAVGAYTVTMTATDSLGQTGTATEVVNVLTPPTVSAGPSLTANEGSAVTFSQATAIGPIPLRYRWDFGDGSAMVGLLNPTHVYRDNGIYTATLAVTDTRGLVTTSSVAVTVADVAPTASISVPATGTATQPISFSASATDPSLADQVAGFTYDWDFGDGTTGTGITPAHVYAAPGTYKVSVTATDKQGTTSTAAVGSIVVVAPSSAGSTVNITSSWLQQQGPGPYLLNQANTTYVLQSDVTTTGTAFVVLAPNVTLNLNGHTVTYGNSQPVVVPNGGFENGSGTNVPGWDITGAPAANLAPNTNFLFGNQVLRLSNFSTTQTIVSDLIPISLINHTYEATITPGNMNVIYGTALTLNVIDSVTGQILATGSSTNNIQRGFSAVAKFTPTTNDPLQLQVVVTPPAGKTTTLDLDAATLTVSYDYGIIASQCWSGSFPGAVNGLGSGFNNLPASVQSIYNPNRSSVKNFTLENGSIVQGQGDGTNSSPLFFEYLNGLTVNNVTTYDTGIDTTNLDGRYASGNIIVTNSTFQDNIPNVTNRMAGPTTVSFGSTQGTILIDGNRILGSPQNGIVVDTNNGYSLAINDNYISQKGVVADAYGIGLVGVSNFQVVGNTIVPQSGGGICMDGFRTLSTNGVIQDNYVDVHEVPNRETGVGRTYARALRLRNYDGSPNSAHTNIDISGNTLIANSGPGYCQYAYAVWVTYINPVGAMDNANVNLHDNTIEGIAGTTDPTYRAYGLVLDGVAPGINITISNNVLASNDTSLSLGGYNAMDDNGVMLIGNTLDKLTNAPARPYTGISAGINNVNVNNITILDTLLENGATATFSWLGTGAKSIQMGTTLDILVQNADGSAASGASVQILGKNNAILYQGTTNAKGLLSDVPVVLTSYVQQAGTAPTTVTTTASGPLTIQVTNGTKQTSLIVNPSPNQKLSVVVTD